MVPLSLSVVTVLFTDAERPRAVGVWATANFLTFPIGPILGGWLLTNYWWGWVFLLNLPVVLVGMIAVAVLLPESRATERPGMDPVGVLASYAGMAVLVYGFIAAGQYGWGSAIALASIAGGALILAGFTFWERLLTRRPGGQPLVDLGLFRSARFTWGTILAGMGLFALFGLLFAAPKYFQAILGVSPMGSGQRLLPMMAGLAAGAGLADRIASLVGAKVTVTLGFAVLAAGLMTGAIMSVTSGDAFISAWTAVSGLGFGLAVATAASAALAEQPEERAGVGSAVMQAVQKAGAPLAAAILGSVLNSGYIGQLHLAGLPPVAADAVRSGVMDGLAVARKLGSPSLLESVRSAFVHGMDTMLWVSGGLAVMGIVLALAFLPWRATETNKPAAEVTPPETPQAQPAAGRGHAAAPEPCQRPASPPARDVSPPPGSNGLPGRGVALLEPPRGGDNGQRPHLPRSRQVKAPHRAAPGGHTGGLSRPCSVSAT
jgi:MFS transporter, DHA2 family, multidrug resistance protein